MSKEKESKNKNLRKAKKEKNDEFYTQMVDIENELKNYKKHFKDKTVFCNCDDPESSNFWKYFYLNFNHLGLKKLISTHYNLDGSPSYKLEYDGINEPVKIALEGNGDFRSEECIEILQEADILCTNPPFSLFREYIAQLIKYNKKFLILGNQNAITYKEIFPLIKNNKIWLGCKNNISMKFNIPDSYTTNGKTSYIDENGNKIATVAGISWFTNLEHSKRNEEMILYKKYDPEKYPKYDKYDAINVNKVNEIPLDYDGIMGVPITFIDKYNPKQFEIIGLDRYTAPKDSLVGGRLTVNNQITYARILIKAKEEESNEDRT